MPKGKPPFLQASAAFRNVSVVQLSALGGLPAGYISWTSILANFFIRSMREQGPLIWLPMQAGTPSHLLLALPRYCAVPLTSPFSWISGPIMSFTGSICSACACGHQLGIARMSWPDLAWASAAMVSRFLLPIAAEAQARSGHDILAM